MLTVGQVIDRLRDEYADATSQIVPEPSLARHLSDYQRTLMRKCFLINDNFKAQQASIVFSFSDSNDPAVVGRGTSGGLPIVVEADGDYAVVRSRTGSLIEYDFSSGAALVNERQVVAHTVNSLDAAGTAWVVDQFVDKIVRIVTGKGSAGAPRLVLSNTATRIVATQNWEIEPDDTSTFEVLEVEPDVTSELGVATSSDPTRQRTGYLVKEDADGIAYIDYSSPLRATFATGVPLPPHLKLLGGDVRYSPVGGQTPNPLPLDVTTHRGRSYDSGLPRAFVMNGELFVCGGQRYWRTATSIDLRYSPIPPSVYADTDAFLLSDAEGPLVTRAIQFAHKRAKALGVASADPATAIVDHKEAETDYLSALQGLQPAAKYTRRDTFGKRW